MRGEHQARGVRVVVALCFGADESRQRIGEIDVGREDAHGDADLSLGLDLVVLVGEFVANVSGDLLGRLDGHRDVACEREAANGGGFARESANGLGEGAWIGRGERGGDGGDRGGMSAAGQHGRGDEGNGQEAQHSVGSVDRGGGRDGGRFEHEQEHGLEQERGRSRSTKEARATVAAR